MNGQSALAVGSHLTISSESSTTDFGAKRIDWGLNRRGVGVL